MAYTSPSILDLVPGTTIDQFYGFDSVSTNLQVQTSESTLTCGGNCDITYSWNWTPTLYYFSPPVVFYGARFATGVNPMNAPNKKASTELAVEIRTNGTNVDFSEFFDEEWEMSTNTFYMVEGFV